MGNLLDLKDINFISHLHLKQKVFFQNGLEFNIMTVSNSSK